VNQWSFVIAAYAIVLGGSALLVLWAWHSMRAAERRSDEVTRR